MARVARAEPFQAGIGRFVLPEPAQLDEIADPAFRCLGCFLRLAP